MITETAVDIIVSLEPRHAENILIGTKTIELRKRKIEAKPETRLWLYSKKPIAAVVGHVTVQETITLEPPKMWDQFGDCIKVTKTEFFDYLADKKLAYGLMLTHPYRLKQIVSLDAMRNAEGGFAPPQFYKKLNVPGDKIGPLLRAAISR